MAYHLSRYAHATKGWLPEYRGQARRIFRNPEPETFGHTRPFSMASSPSVDLSCRLEIQAVTLKLKPHFRFQPYELALILIDLGTRIAKIRECSADKNGVVMTNHR